MALFLLTFAYIIITIKNKKFMKKTIAISLLSLTISVNAQIKVFTGGLQSYGSTTSPASGEKHHFTGDLVVAEAGTTTSGCALLRANGSTNVSSATRPDFTWLGNNNTGLFHPGSNLIGFTIGGSEKWRIHSNGQLLSNLSPSASTPDYSWNGDAGAGIYHPASNTIGFTIAGTERMRINSNGQILFATGLNSWAPNISWTGDISTGIFQPSSQTIGFTINGAEAMRISSLRNLLLGGSSEWNSRFVSIAENNKAAITAVTSHTFDYGYCQANYVNRDQTKAYAVINSATGSNVETYNVKGSGDVWAKSTTNWSDKNLKENIDSLQSSLSKIKQLKGVKYNFKASFVGNGPIKTEIGLIAQDVEQIIPEVVNTNEFGMKGIVYHNLIPVLIEAIKELDAKNTKLENDLNTCCSKNNGGKTSGRLGNTNNEDETNSTLEKSYMKQNKPNPFSKETIIEYNIVQEGTASIIIFDMNGKLLKTIPVKIPGKGNIIISANDFNPGMYYYTLVVNDNEIDTKKMILTE
jgi:hypothetical protein